MTEDIELGQLSDLVVDVQLSGGLNARAYRDGLFVFDFSEWAPITDGPPSEEAFYERADSILKRVSLMNAHVACLHTALARVQDSDSAPVRALSPDSIFSFRTGNPEEGAGLPHDPIAELISARYPLTYNPRWPHWADWRIRTRWLVELQTAEESFGLLDGLVAIDSTRRAVALCDLLVRASGSYSGHDYNQALLTSWTIIESLIQELWENYVQENRTRVIDGETVPFINADRKRRLTEDRDMTASLRVEMLSLIGSLSPDLYTEISTVRVARNRWLHTLEPVSGLTASLALEVTEKMLRQVVGLDLSLPRSLSISY